MNTPLVFLHGWGQHSGAWTKLFAELNPQLKTQCLDLPGHGQQPWQAPYFELDALVDSLSAQAPPRCIVVGWSLGGMLALRWAQRHPQQVAKLVLIGSTPCFGQRDDGHDVWSFGAPAAMQSAFAAQVAAHPERSLQNFADLLALGESNVRGVSRDLRTLLATAPLPAAAALDAGLDFLARTDLRASLLEQPPQQATLLLHGEGDTITPLAASQWLANTLPHATLHTLPACGHAPMVSQPAVVAAALHKFLDE